MREVQGGVIGSAFFIMFFSMSGLLRAVLHYISPITGKEAPLVYFNLHRSDCPACMHCTDLNCTSTYIAVFPCMDAL